MRIYRRDNDRVYASINKIINHNILCIIYLLLLLYYLLLVYIYIYNKLIIINNIFISS